MENGGSENFLNKESLNQDMDIRRERPNSVILSDLDVVLIISACLIAIIGALIFAIKNQLCGHCMLYGIPKQTKVNNIPRPRRLCELHFHSERHVKRSRRGTHRNGLPTYSEALALEKYTRPNTIDV